MKKGTKQEVKQEEVAVENVVETSAQEVSQAAPAQPELTVNDLSNLKNIVEVAVRRGAFTAAEASSVGSVYDRLNAFLTAVTAPKPEEATAETPAQ